MIENAISFRLKQMFHYKLQSLLLHRLLPLYKHSNHSFKSKPLTSPLKEICALNLMVKSKFDEKVEDT